MRQFIRCLVLACIGVGSLWLTGPLASDHGSAPPVGGESGLIAIPEFAVSTSQASDMAARIRQLIKERLAQLGSYALSDATDVATSIDVDRPPAFSIWKSRQVRFQVIAQVGIQHDGRLRI